MKSGIFTTLLTKPLYNGLIFLMSFVPGADAGIAIVVFTLLVRLVLYPLSKKSTETQLKMKASEAEVARIKSQYTDKAQQAAQIMAFYKTKGLNPLAGFALIIVQIPIIFALYYVFLKSGLPQINTDLLYSFVKVPDVVNMNFLGLLDISQKSYLLSALCAVSQFFQIKFSLPAGKPRTTSGTFKDDLARNMNLQMKYFFPVMVFFISYQLAGTVALYWTTSNLFAIGQELYVRRKFAKMSATKI